jgi:branched-subunit amino acid aminotransferase/4-amino-4-deoxychorismate lyase
MTIRPRERSAVVIDGELSEGSLARISVFDRGFLYGDGVSETLRARGSRTFALREHLERLARSCQAIRLDAVDAAAVARDVTAALEALDAGDAAVRIMVTRGDSGLALDDVALEAKPCTIVMARAISPPLRAVAPVRVVRTDVSLSSPRGAKPLAYLPAIVERRRAKERGFDDALFVDATGHVLEAATANIFAVKRGAIVTPRKGVLHGVTRAQVLDVARVRGIHVEEAPLSWDGLLDSDEIFLTSSLRGIAPVSAVETHAFQAPGPITKVIAEGYFERLTAALGNS